MARNYNKRENDLAIENAKLKQELIAATNDPNLLNQSNIINRKTRPDLYPDTNTNTNPENIPGEIIDPIQLTIPGLEGARNPLQISPQVAQRNWANQMRIGPQVAELYLPGERGSTPGGLGNMNKDSLERWIKENGITGAGADKIRNKWKGLQGDINLPLVQAPSQNGMLISQAHVEALKKAAKGNKTSNEIRSILEKFTKPDQFGHPTGSFRGA